MEARHGKCVIAINPNKPSVYTLVKVGKAKTLMFHGICVLFVLGIPILAEGVSALINTLLEKLSKGQTT